METGEEAVRELDVVRPRFLRLCEEGAGRIETTCDVLAIRDMSLSVVRKLRT